MLDLWYKNAVVYCLDVDAYMDSNGDGIGDFRGLEDRLDHIEALGATCIWLLPFYQSPNRDNGYDISDYYAVDPRLGTLGDFVCFTRAARDRGLRVIVDLVVNHTSTEHPWFRSARSDPASPHRDWYVWSKEKPENIHEGIVFPGVQEAIWTWDDEAGAWYLHRFYDHQADLNVFNPEVREEIDRIMGFWLELGVSGFRIDAAPFLVERLGVDIPEREDPTAYLRQIRRFVSWRRSEAVLLAEANVTLDDVQRYFGHGAKVHLVFHFILNQHLFLGLARRSALPLKDVLERSPALDIENQWASFLRNHDELDLGRLTEDERREVFDAMAPEPGMIAYGRGIRRRLASMLGGDGPRLRLAWSLLFALPGTPVLWYGEEIGMGENLDLTEREAVRTPLQWTDERNGGFSLAAPERLVRALPDGAFGPERVNIRAQGADPASLLNFMRELIRRRRAAPEIGWARPELLDTDGRVLGLRMSWQGNTTTTWHNLSDEAVEIALDVPGDGEGASTVWDGREEVTVRCEPGARRRLAPCGFLWAHSRPERR